MPHICDWLQCRSRLVFVVIGTLQFVASAQFDLVGKGFCMDSGNKFYDSYGAFPGEFGYDGSVEMCRSRSAAEQFSVGFAYSVSASECQVYVENGKLVSTFSSASNRIQTSTYGSGRISRASGQATHDCYRKQPTTTTTKTTSTFRRTTTTTTTTPLASAPSPGLSSSNSEFKDTTDGYCVDSVTADLQSFSSSDAYDLRDFLQMDACWDYCTSEPSCAGCFRPCGPAGFRAVSRCSIKTSMGCGAYVRTREKAEDDPLMVVKVVAICAAVFIFLAGVGIYLWWRRKKQQAAAAAGAAPLVAASASAPATKSPTPMPTKIPASDPAKPAHPHASPPGAVHVQEVGAVAHVASEEGGKLKSDTMSTLPDYWTHNKETTDFNAMVYVKEDQVQHFDRLLKETYRAKSTQDRPCPLGKCAATPGGCECVQPHGDPGLPAGYTVRKVIRVEDSRMWERYVKKRCSIQDRRQSAGVEQLRPPCKTVEVVGSSADAFSPLDGSLNEVYLWHGTHVRAALSIAHSDFRIDLAGSSTGTMYGRGCYLAENCTKADEYARDEPHGYYEGVFALLLCRVVLGKYYYTTKRDERAGDSVARGEFDSTLGDRLKAVDTFREFVVCNADQVYPEFIILYSRRPKIVDELSFKFGLTAFQAELPVYWQHCHVNPRIDSFDKQYHVRRNSSKILEELAQSCWVDAGVNSLKVVSARRIEHSNIWNRYVQFKLRLKNELKDSGLPEFASAELLEGKSHRGLVLTHSFLKDLANSGAQTTISVDNLEEVIQEHLLWHGTSKESAEAIVKADFRLPAEAKHGQRFGNGLYFAEDIGKSLSYAPIDANTNCQYLLLCRVLCGQMRYTEELSDGSATVSASKSGKHSVLANPLSKGPREFIVLTESQVYPEYLIEVRRN